MAMATRLKVEMLTEIPAGKKKEHLESGLRQEVKTAAGWWFTWIVGKGTSTTRTGKSTMKFCTDIPGPKRIITNNVYDPLTCYHQAEPSPCSQKHNVLTKFILNVV